LHGFGFSFVELLVALVVVALLAAVAIPTYVRYSDTTYRREGQADLLNCAQAMERLAADSFSYANAADGDGDGTGDSDVGPIAASVCLPTSAERYQISVNGNATTYSLIATPTGAMAGDGAITFDAAGNRAWDRDGDGVIEIDAGENGWNL
jgi:type IV pilus assembly protein PilE